MKSSLLRDLMQRKPGERVLRLLGPGAHKSVYSRILIGPKAYEEGLASLFNGRRGDNAAWLGRVPSHLQRSPEHTNLATPCELSGLLRERSLGSSEATYRPATFTGARAILLGNIGRAARSRLLDAVQIMLEVGGKTIFHCPLAWLVDKPQRLLVPVDANDYFRGRLRLTSPVPLRGVALVQVDLDVEVGR